MTVHDIDDWVAQFHQHSGAAWVGEGLLASLRVMRLDEVVRSLDMTPGGLAGFDRVAVNDFETGGSARAIAFAAEKWIGEPLIGLDGLKEALDTPGITRVLCVEDALWSGNESVRVVAGLLGLPSLVGSPKARPVADAQRFRDQQELVLRYAVVCEGGREYLEAFLQKHKLRNNIRLDATLSRTIAAHTASGIRAIQNGALYTEDGLVNDLDAHLRREIFRDLSVWGNERKADRARQICETIGVQLYNAQATSRLSPEQRQQSGLGVKGHCLAIAFGHSVPKDTLPVFWAAGDVTPEAKPHFRWTPLFRGGGTFTGETL